MPPSSSFICVGLGPRPESAFSDRPPSPLFLTQTPQDPSCRSPDQNCWQRALLDVARLATDDRLRAGRRKGGRCVPFVREAGSETEPDEVDGLRKRRPTDPFFDRRPVTGRQADPVLASVQIGTHSIRKIFWDSNDDYARGWDSRENVCWKGRRGREREEGGGRRQGRLNARREKDGRQRGSRRKGWEGVCACVCVCHGRVLSSKRERLETLLCGKTKNQETTSALEAIGVDIHQRKLPKTHLSWPSPFKAPPDCS